MQLACVEFARNVCGLDDAMTTEVDEATTENVIDFLPEQGISTSRADDAAGRLRSTLEGLPAARAYGALEISERHRHRYEFNNK